MHEIIEQYWANSYVFASPEEYVVNTFHFTSHESWLIQTDMVVV